MDDTGRGRRRIVKSLAAAGLLAVTGFGLLRAGQPARGACVANSELTENSNDDLDAQAPLPVSAILVCAFGYRLNDAGLRLPGRINETLAAISNTLFRQYGCPVYAQWEVAQAMEGAIPRDRLTAIFPLVNEDNGQSEYLSTAGVIRRARAQMAGSAEAGRVLVVAHKDHVCRCVDLARRAGLDADAAPVALPSEYDPLSQQWWTRHPRVYRYYDQLARLLN